MTTLQITHDACFYPMSQQIEEVISSPAAGQRKRAVDSISQALVAHQPRMMVTNYPSQPHDLSVSLACRESIENRTLLCRGVKNEMSPEICQKELERAMEEEKLKFVEDVIRKCARLPKTGDMMVEFRSAEMATRALHLNGYLDLHDDVNTPIWMFRPPGYKGANLSSNSCWQRYNLTQKSVQRLETRRDHARRTLLVMNVPLGIESSTLKDFLVKAMVRRSLNAFHGDPITLCVVAKRPLITLRTEEEVESAVLHLHNVVFKGQKLQFVKALKSHHSAECEMKMVKSPGAPNNETDGSSHPPRSTSDEVLRGTLQATELQRVRLAAGFGRDYMHIDALPQQQPDQDDTRTLERQVANIAEELIDMYAASGNRLQLESKEQHKASKLAQKTPSPGRSEEATNPVEGYQGMLVSPKTLTFPSGPTGASNEAVYFDLTHGEYVTGKDRSYNLGSNTTEEIQRIKLKLGGNAKPDMNEEMLLWNV